MLSSKDVYENIFRMQRLFVDINDEEKIRNAVIAQVGVGGIGGYIFEGLVRNGFSNIRLAEKDCYEINNYRQLYMTTETIGIEKAEVAKSRALQINPYVDVQIHDKLSGNNARVFFQNATVIVQEADTLVASMIAHYWGKMFNIPVVHAARKHWENSHIFSVKITDYRNRKTNYIYEDLDFEKYWGISNEQAKQVLYMIKNELNTTEIEREIDSLNREFRRNRISKLIQKGDEEKISKFSRNKSILYMDDMMNQYPMIYDKQRVAPEQVMLMGAMGCNAVKKLVLGDLGELNELSF